MTSESPPTRPITWQSGQRLGSARDDEAPAGGLVEQRRAPSERHPSADLAGQAAFGQRHREAALGDVVGAVEAARANPVADRLEHARGADSRDRRQRSRRRLPAQLCELGANGRERHRTSRPARSRRPRARTPGARHATASGSLPTIPITGVGKIGPGRPLVVQRDVAADDRHAERPAASASPATASVSCQATCGFSGLPKFRQFVSPSGSAPTQARLAAHSYTASAAPARGSQATRRPLPSIETAMPDAVRQRQHGGVGLLGTAHRARLDDRVVLLEHRPPRGQIGRAQQGQQTSAPASSSPFSTAAGAGYSGADGGEGARS